MGVAIVSGVVSELGDMLWLRIEQKDKNTSPPPHLDHTPRSGYFASVITIGGLKGGMTRQSDAGPASFDIRIAGFTRVLYF